MPERAGPGRVAAFAIDAVGDRGAVRPMPEPHAGPGEVVVRVGAASVNPSDWRVRRGGRVGRAEHRFPLVLGFDVAGVVDEAGPGAEWSPGERLAGILVKPWLGDGTFAERVLVPSGSACATVPTGLDLATAAAAPSAALTALEIVDVVSDLGGGRQGATAVVVGAAGGVGSFTTQLLARAGAHVVAVTSTRNVGYVESNGAASVVDRTAGDVADELARRWGRGVDVLVDLVHARDQLHALATAAVAPGGAVVSAVYAADVESFETTGLRAANVVSHPTAERTARVLAMLADGSLRAPEVTRRPLADAAAAIDVVEAGRQRGKVVLEVAP